MNHYLDDDHPEFDRDTEYPKRLVYYVVVWGISIFVFLFLLPWNKYPGAAEFFVYFDLFSFMVLFFWVVSLTEKLRWHRAAILCDIVFIPLLILPLLYFFQRSRSEFYAYPLAKDVAVSESLKDVNATPIFVLLSDLHVTDQSASLEGWTETESKATAVMTEALKKKPRFCLLTGDLTDRGTDKEWNLLESVFSKSLHARRRSECNLFFLPGNHDLQGAPQEVIGDYAAFYPIIDVLQYQMSYATRAQGFFRLAERWEETLSTTDSRSLSHTTFPAFWRVTSAEKRDATIKYEPPALGATQPSFHRVYPQGTDSHLSQTIGSFNELFPLVYDHRKKDGIVLFLLNTSVQVNPGGSMGIGNLGGSQIRRLEDYLKTIHDDHNLKHLIVALHHAPVRRQSDVWSFSNMFSPRITDSDVWATTFLALNLQDTRNFINVLDAFAESRKDVDVIVMHGHRHERFLGVTQKGVWIVESPATGNMKDYQAGFWAGFKINGKLQIRWMLVHPNLIMH